MKMETHLSKIPKEKINAGNRSIAEFMAKFMGEDGYKSRIWTTYSWKEPEFNMSYVTDLKFHSSWGWLMPVIEIISRHSFEDGDTAYPRTFAMPNKETGNLMIRFNRYSLHESESFIEAAWQAVIEFIENKPAESKIITPHETK